MTATPYRYGAWRGGPDPLAPPYDVRAAVDALGERGARRRQPARRAARPAAARPGGRPGARRPAGPRPPDAPEALRRGNLDGAVTRAQALLDQALAAEREALAGRDDDDARFAEARLDACPARPRGRSRSSPTTTGRATRRARRTSRSSTGCATRCSSSASPACGGARRAPTGDPEAGRAHAARCSATSTTCSAKHARGEDTADAFARVHGTSTATSSRRTRQTSRS